MGLSRALSTREVQAAEKMELCSLKNNSMLEGQNQDSGVLGPMSQHKSSFSILPSFPALDSIKSFHQKESYQVLDVPGLP